ncbi:diguanylate cyclase [Desulfohalovibrio reitneri]|uniref:diguanylate cyclase n=1 Tax=Desulfohalovibrio reitneri TaxID=1307759 RepID=UPI0004A6BEE9|nr:diguanylate cyclase [Desulfohalovibrio reitneri]
MNEETHGQERPEGGRAPADSPAERVLVVDFDPGRREHICRILSRHGHKVVPRDNADSAERAMAAEPCSLAFVAVRHLGRSGFDLARALRDFSPSLGLVFVSSSESLDDAVQALRFGACDFLHPPHSEEDVVLAVHRFRDRARLEDLAFQARLRYDHLVQNIPLILFSLDEDLRLIFINRAVQHVLGYSDAEVLDQPGFLLERTAEDDRERLAKRLASAVERSSPFTTQARLVHKNGHEVHCLIRSMPRYSLTSQAGAPGVDGVIMDISDRVVLERALIQDERLKVLGGISAEVAHEFRNPLMIIGGFARRLLRDHPGSREAEIVLAETGRLERLLCRIRDYLRPLRIMRRPTSVNRVARECLDLLASDMDERGVTAEPVFDPDLPEVNLDPDLLGQLLVTLLIYCARRMPEGGLCHLRTLPEGEGLRLEVEADVSRHLVLPDKGETYSPFEEGGEQLEIPLCYRLARGLGGYLSRNPTPSGVRFSLTLPGDGAAPETLYLDGGDEDAWCRWRSGLGPDFEANLRREWKRAQRSLRSICVLAVDVDHYGAFVSRQGRGRAEDLSGKISEVIEESLKRPGDFHDGNDGVFTVVLPETDNLGGLLVAESVRDGVVGLAVANPDSEAAPLVTVSIGVASMPPGPDDEPDVLMEEAVSALHEAKRQGGNRAASSEVRREGEG